MASAVPSGMVSPVGRPPSSAASVTASTPTNDLKSPAAGAGNTTPNPSLAARRAVANPPLVRTGTASGVGNAPKTLDSANSTLAGAAQAALSMGASAASALGSPSTMVLAAGGLTGPGGHRFRQPAAVAVPLVSAIGEGVAPTPTHAGMTDEEELAYYLEDPPVDGDVKTSIATDLGARVIDAFDPAFDPSVFTGVRVLPPVAPLIAAATAGDWKGIIRLIEAVPVINIVEYVNQYDSEGNTPLFYVLDKPEQLDALETLLCYGANPNAQCRGPINSLPQLASANAPLHLACRKMNKKASRLLIYRGAKLDVENAQYEVCYQHVENDEAKTVMQVFVQKCEEEYVEMKTNKKILPATVEQLAMYKYMFDAIDRDRKGAVTIREIAAVLVTMDPDVENEYKLPPTEQILPYIGWLESHNRDEATKIDFQTFVNANIAHLNAKGKWLKRLAKKRARKLRPKPKADAKK